MQTHADVKRRPGLDTLDQRGVPESGPLVEYLDVATVLKVSQAVSGEIVLEKLVEVLLRTAIEQAGAERALLIFPRGSELWIQAEATTRGDSVTVRLSEAPVSAAELPDSIVRYVARTQETVILDDASARNPYSTDEYIHKQRLRSVLCLPLAKQSTLVALLYLENNIGPNIFAPAKITVLKVLASAAAISLDNSRLYRDLQEREGRIRRLVDANIIGVLISDSEGQIIESNDAFLKMVGYTREELVSGRMRWRDMTPVEWKDVSDRGVVQVNTTGVCNVFEKEYYRKDGSRVPVLVGAARFEKNSIVAFAIDLTERKRAEEALRSISRDLQESKARLEEAQRITHVGHWVWDSGTSCLTWSDETYRIFGFRPQERPIDVAAFQEMVHPEDREFWLQETKKALRGEDHSDIEFRIVHPSGEVRTVHSLGGVKKDKSGKPCGRFGTVQDITDRKRAEEALQSISRDLQESNAKLEEAQRIAHIGHWERDLATGHITWSDEIYRIFGLEPQERPMNLPALWQFIHPEDGEPLSRAIDEALAGGAGYDTEYRVLRHTGEIRIVHSTGDVKRDASGRPYKMFGVAQDVTDRKRAEEELRASEAKLRRGEAFLAEGQRLSHMGSWAWNASSGKVTWSQEHFRILGLDPQDTTPSLDVFWERIHPDDRTALQRTFESAIKEKRDFEQEFRIVTPDWSIRHINGVGHAVLNKANELAEFIGSTMDITELRRAEERAQSHNEAVRLALNAFVKELDVDRFLEHMITGLTKQFEAMSSELWLFDGTTQLASLYMACHQGRVIGAEAVGRRNGIPHFTWQPSNVGRIVKIIELPAQKSLLQPAHFESLLNQGIKTLVLVPLVLGEQNLGFIELHFKVATRLTSDDLDHAQALVHHATLALQLSRLAHRTEHMAVMEERNRMAREIHDTLAQAFAGIVLHSEALGTALGVNKLRSKRALSNIQKLARSGLEEARRSVQALRPRALEGCTLSQALEQMAKRYSEEAKFACDFKQQGAALMLSEKIQNELFRIAQEAMTNISKHAQAKSVKITFEFKDNQAILTVRDDGIGFSATNSPKPKGGYGLSTMRERAQRIGGQIEIKSPTDGGTAIRVLVPLTEKEKPSSQTI